MKGACPCGIVFKGEGCESSLRGHVARAHPQAFHDDDGRVIVKTAPTMRDAWLILHDGFPVLVEDNAPRERRDA